MELKRTILVVPGHRRDFAEKCRTYGADQILWDLEDGVPSNQKKAAREIVAQHLQPADAVRVNVPSVNLANDLAMLRGFDFLKEIWVPKVEGDHVLAGIVDLPDVSFVALVETPLGVFRLPQILAFPLRALAFGREDFMAAGGLSPYQEDAIDHAGAQVALAAMARGIPAWQSPCFEWDGDLMDAAVKAKSLGFTGMGCIHPKQIGPVRRAFETWDAEARWAQQIIDDGETMPPRVRAAKRLLGVE